MDDFGTVHYGHDFQHGQPFDHDAHQFQDFMGQKDHQHQPGTDGGFDMNSMDLYNTSAIYPNLAQENAEYGRSSFIFDCILTLFDLMEVPPQSLSIPVLHPTNSIQPTTATTITTTIDPNSASTSPPTGTTRQNFKFNPEQKKIMLDKFNAGLHYPTNSEKDDFAATFGVSTDSVSHFHNSY
jgi:hypothetical protein